MFNSIVALLTASSFVSTAFAHPSKHPFYPSNGVCTDYFVTDTVTASEYQWAPPKFRNNVDVASFLFASTRKDASSLPPPITGPKNVTKEYTVSGTFCSPKTKKNGKESTVLLATHGLGYDRRYWASEFKEREYSFANYVLGNGYSIFYYDRIGVAKSSLESGYETQASNAAGMIGKIAQAIKAGKYTSDIKTKKIVLVGHSFGSATSNALIAAQPDLVDGAVLTGYSLANSTDKSNLVAPWILTSFAARIASTISKQFSRLDTGYLAFGDIYAHAETFFHDYEVDALEYAQSITQPLGVIEPISLGTVNPSAPAFKGSVLITSGEFDFIYCGGECKSTFAGGVQNEVFSGAKVESYVHPGAGHGMNFGKNATGFYAEVVGFLDRSF